MHRMNVMTREHFMIVALLFLIIGLVLYSRVIAFGPFLFDDNEYVIDNAQIRDISSACSLNDARQLGYLSFAVNYALGGENPVGYHLFNVMVHIVNSLLAVLLALIILRRLNNEEELPDWSVPAALLTGLLFLVHPMQTQAVSYITQRFTSLSTMFYLLSVFLYLLARQYVEDGKHIVICSYLLFFSFLSTIAAMRTKEIAITIPIMLFFLEMLLYRNSGFGRKRLFFLAPFIVTFLIIPLSIFGPELGITSAVDGTTDVIRTDKIHDLTQRSPLQYLFTETRVLVVYLRLLFFPAGQRVIYDFPVSTRFFDPSVLAAFIFLTGIGAGAYYCWKKYISSAENSKTNLAYGLASIGILWFFAAISVESSVLPIKDVIFEHRVYLPSFGVFAVVSTILAYGFRRMHNQLLFIILLVLVILLPLGVGTCLRNEVWTDELNFWNDVIEKSPQKAMGYNNRATVFAKREEYGKALEDFNRVISFFPKSTEELFKWENADYSPWNMSKSYTGRGNVYIALGGLERAAEDFKRAREVFSMPVDADNLLVEADTLAKKGLHREAVWIYDRILEWDPLDVRALNDRANAYSYLAQFPEAINDLTKVIALDPAYIVAYHNRGLAYMWAGKKDKAVEDFRQACKKGFEPACKNIDSAQETEK